MSFQREQREKKLQLFRKVMRHIKYIKITRYNQRPVWMCGCCSGSRSERVFMVLINQWPAYDTQSYHQKHISNSWSTSRRNTLHRLPSKSHWYVWFTLNNAQTVCWCLCEQHFCECMSSQVFQTELAIKTTLNSLQTLEEFSKVRIMR